MDKVYLVRFDETARIIRAFRFQDEAQKYADSWNGLHPDMPVHVFELDVI